MRKAFDYLRSPGSGILLLFVAFVAVPLALAIVFSRNVPGLIAAFLIISIGGIVWAEMMFRLGHRIYFGGPYEAVPRIPFEQLYVEPHPYIPFIYKQHFTSQKGGPANYPLHKGRFSFGQHTTNNFRFNNGERGDRDIVVPKPEGLFRIDCIGASTTGNYIAENGKEFSYPMELEKVLRQKLGRPVEVNNCAQGGYNSADLLVRFALKVIDTQPDVVVIYHAYNDIRAYLTPQFDADYSHCRRNLGESYWLYAIAGKIPNVPLKFLNFLIDFWLPTNIRHSLLEQVSKGKVVEDLDPAPGLRIYRRNLQHIIDLCRANGIDVVLSTYCQFLYDEIRNDPLHRIYCRILEQENNVMRELAAANKLQLVDNAQLVPQDERYFVDSVHFTPEGMQMIAANIAPAIQSLAEKRG